MYRKCRVFIVNFTYAKKSQKKEKNQQLVRFEAYPNIKSQVLREKYQNEVSKLEREIQDSTELYNANVAEYNTFIKSFPANFFCNIYGRKSLKYID